MMPAQAWLHGNAPQPANATIPVVSLANGNYSANNWAGFTTSATSVASHVMTPNPNNQQIFATSAGAWRDQEISTYMGGRGTLYLRLGADGQAIYASFNLTAGNSLSIGIVQNFVATPGIDTGAMGTFYGPYNNSDPTSTLTGYGVTGSIYTFGTSGFEIYLKINGVKVISYIEWRLCRSGQMAVWAQSGVSQDIVATYLPLQSLYSNPSAQVYDPRDFGMRNVAATTGSMAQGSNQITGVTAGTFQVGDRVIVCIGGEAGAGARGTKGVGGTWPALNYANTTAMNADISQAVGTFAYDASSSPLAAYAWNGSAWTHTHGGGGGGTYSSQSYYTEMAIPLPLVAAVTNVSGTTVTLNATASVATANADVRLDCLPGFFVLNQTASSGATAPNPTNITVSIPSSQGTADQAWYISDVVTNNSILLASGVTVAGAGRTLTTLKSPKSCPPAAFNLPSINANNVTLSDMKYIGNNGANGYGFFHGINTFTSYCTAFYLNSPGAVNSGLIIKNIDAVDCIGPAGGIAGSSPLIDNCTAVMNGEQYDYVQWQFVLSNSSGGKIQNCTTTGTYLLKSFELFACNGSQIVGCGGTNPLYSTNSSQSWTIDCRGLTVNYTAGCFINQLTGWIDEAIFNVNNNAFGSGNSGTIYLGRHIQQGYIDASNNSLKFIQAAAAQTDLTVIGSYPGGGGCSTSLDGLLQAPNFSVGSPEYGAMAIYSDAPRTIVSGIRIKGTAIGTPGHSGHFGNISLLGASSQANNCVADVIQTGPTLSGNQSNAAYGGC